MHITSIGIDLGKTTFHLVALDDHEQGGAQQEVLPQATAGLYCEPANLPDWDRSVFGSALHRRGLRRQGHDVRLIPAQFVKPFVKSNKNDFLDAEAIAEAVTRQNMRVSFPSRPTTSSTCRLCTGCAIDWCIAAPR